MSIRRASVREYLEDVPLGRRLARSSSERSLTRGSPCDKRSRPRDGSLRKADLVKLFRREKLSVGRHNKATLCAIAKHILPRADVAPIEVVETRVAPPVVLTGEVDVASTPVGRVETRACFGPGFPKAGVRLHPHQKKVVLRVLAPDCRGLILYFKVGSGKTIASIAAAEALRHAGECTRGVLYIGAPAIQRQVRRDLAKVGGHSREWTLMSGEALRRKPVSARGRLLVVDEAHNFRNPTASAKVVAQAAQQASKVLLLTGTPVANKPSDLLPLLHMVNPEARVVAADFEQLSPRLLAALQCSVQYYKPPKENSAYPRKEVRRVEVTMSREQTQAHYHAADPVRLAELLGEPDIAGHPELGKKLVSFLSGPRQICNKFQNSAPKLQSVAKQIARDVGQGRKSVAFSEFVGRGGAPLSDALRIAGVAHRRIDGSTPNRVTEEYIREYNEDRVPVLVFSRTISEGIDLKHTQVVHVVEAQWNASRVQQVVGRAVRQNSHVDPGVPKVVRVYQWISVMDHNTPPDTDTPWRQESADEIVAKLSAAKDTDIRAFLTALATMVDGAACPVGACDLG